MIGRVVFVIALVTASGLAVMRWCTSLPSARLPAAAQLAWPESRPDSLNEHLTEAEEVIVTNDPFRLANAPATAPYDPSSDGVPRDAASVVAPVVRPTMIVRAIAGPPWQAVVDGIPGQPPGTIVQAGRVFDKLVATSVTRDSVVMRGPDTSWVLTFSVRRP